MSEIIEISIELPRFQLPVKLAVNAGDEASVNGNEQHQCIDIVYTNFLHWRCPAIHPKS
jgi:hypothetical protein